MRKNLDVRKRYVRKVLHGYVLSKKKKNGKKK